MKKHFKLWSVLAMLLVAVCAQAQTEKIKLGDPMPAITLNSETYGNITPDDLKGKVVLVSLFATWCPPCQLELADVQKTLYPKYKDNPDFKLLVIGREHTDADLKNITSVKIHFPALPRPQTGSFLALCRPKHSARLPVRQRWKTDLYFIRLHERRISDVDGQDRSCFVTAYFSEVIIKRTQDLRMLVGHTDYVSQILRLHYKNATVSVAHPMR